MKQNGPAHREAVFLCPPDSVWPAKEVSLRGEMIIRKQSVQTQGVWGRVRRDILGQKQEPPPEILLLDGKYPHLYLSA